MIGKKVTFSFTNEKGNRVEDSGIVMDKFRNTDYILDPTTKTPQAYTHDLYLVQTETSVITLHPTHITKID